MSKIILKLVVNLVRLVVVLLFVTPVLASSFEQDEKIIIAHAGGGNRNFYLNSLEATLKSIQRGYKYIELDLLETSDGDLVAAHDWKTFNLLTGYPNQTNPLSIEECKKRKILKKQTVLTSYEINDVFTQNQDVYLVTDKISNIDLIREKFSTFLDRIIVEVKYPEECTYAKNKNIKYCAFWFNEKYDIDWQTPLLVTIPFKHIEKYREWFLEHPNVQVLVYTINEEKIAKKILNYPFVKGIYSDVLSVAIWEEKK